MKSIAPVSYTSAIRLVKKLKLEDQLRLLETLAELVRSEIQTRPRRSILELQGMGKDIWHGIDAQKYVMEERAAWGG